MSVPQLPRTVAILRFGAAGDVLLCAPAVQALRAVWPAAKLIFVTHARHAGLVAGWPELDDVLSLGDESVGALVRRLRALRPDAVLDLHASLRSRVVAWLSGAKARATWRKRGLDEQLAVQLGQAPYRPKRRQCERSHKAVEALVGCALFEPGLRHTPHPDHVAEGQAAYDSLKLAPVHRPLVMLHPGANWATKRYPIAHYGVVARQLVARGFEVLALGSAQEAPLVVAIKNACPQTLTLAQPVSLAGLAGLFLHAAALVVGDTGPMHLARGLGVPAVIVFGSTPAQAFDLRGHTVLTHPQSCSPCSFFGRSACPRGHMACLEALAPDRIVAAVEQVVACYGPGGTFGRVGPAG